LDYPVTNVFVIFETEKKDQSHVLKELSMGALDASKNKVSALSSPKYLFRS
jgi:hypothetical protein